MLIRFVALKAVGLPVLDGCSVELCGRIRSKDFKEGSAIEDTEQGLLDNGVIGMAFKIHIKEIVPRPIASRP